MANFHQTPEGLMPFTEEEEVQFNAMQYEASLPELVRVAYLRKRAAEYPSMTDYLDGIVKGDQAQVQAYIDACLAVKLKYPKPTE